VTVGILAIPPFLKSFSMRSGFLTTSLLPWSQSTTEPSRSLANGRACKTSWDSSRGIESKALRVRVWSPHSPRAALHGVRGVPPALGHAARGAPESNGAISARGLRGRSEHQRETGIGTVVMLRWVLLSAWLCVLVANGWLFHSAIARAFDGSALDFARGVVPACGFGLSVYGLYWVAGPKWPNGPFS